MSREDLSVRVATTGIVIAAAVNSLTKGGMAAVIGGRRIGLRVGLPLAASAMGGGGDGVAAGLVGAWFSFLSLILTPC